MTVEQLPKLDRFVKAVNAGVDQFGGTDELQYLTQAVDQRKLTRARLEQSAMRILSIKFRQGLFENPYVDETAAASTVGNAAFQAQALDAQRRSLVLLKNRRGILPLKADTKVYLRGIAPDVATQHGLQVVDTPEAADVAIVRASTPYEVLHPTYAFGARAKEGNLAFGPGNADYEAIKDISAKVPTIVTVYMDRPAILTAIEPMTQALLANFGATDPCCSTCSPARPHRAADSRSSCHRRWPRSRPSNPTSHTTPPARSIRSATDSPTERYSAAIQRLAHPAGR